MATAFYVYQYHDPVTMVPFYVGKGCRGRDITHLTEARDASVNNLKVSKIREIWSEGRHPLILRVLTTTSEEAAYAEEGRLINLYGRIIDGTGVLTNIVVVGYCNGMTGQHHTAESKLKMSCTKKLRYTDPNTTAKFAAANPRRVPVTDGTIVYLSLSDAARRLNIQKQTAFNMYRRGELYDVGAPAPPPYSKPKRDQRWRDNKAKTDPRSKPLTSGADHYYSINDALKRLRITPKRLASLIESGELRFVST